MPPPPGGAKKKKKGRAPKHQNSFAFRHNPKSKKTDKILSSPNVGVCRRCHDKIEWRKKYRKYKPRTQPGKCNMCGRKNVMAAYHTICTQCATSEQAIAAIEKRVCGGVNGPSATSNSATSVYMASASECKSTCKEKLTLVVESDETTAKIDAAVAAAKCNKASKRRIRACAICTTEPAMSKYSDASGEDQDLIEKIHKLEDALESGIHKDGRKLTVRETKGVERKIEKFQVELKERQKKKKKLTEDAEEDETNAGDSTNVSDNDLDSVAGGGEDLCETGEDPFLLATGGKATVGENYQKMLLARELQM